MMPDPYVDDVEDKSNKVEPTEFEFQQSADIAELSQALCKAQGAMKGAVKDSANPFFKSKYADLSAVWDDIRAPFFDNGISVTQMPAGGVGSVTLITQFTHTSGQWIRSRLTMVPAKLDPQGIGSCLTYARRYTLAAMAGVYQIDDDGNEASKRAGGFDDKPVDFKKIKEAIKDAKDVVDLDDEERGPVAARELYEPLSNDERMRMQAEMKKESPEGCRKTYWAIFHDHLKRAAK